MIKMIHYKTVSLLLVPFIYFQLVLSAGFSSTQNAITTTNKVFDTLILNPKDKNKKSITVFDPTYDVAYFNSFWHSFIKDLDAYIADKAQIIGIEDKDIADAYNKLKQQAFLFIALIDNAQEWLETARAGNTTILNNKTKLITGEIDQFTYVIKQVLTDSELKRLASSKVTLPRKKSAIQVLMIFANNLNKSFAKITSDFTKAVNNI